jgi:succinate-semialdehyde dehydrogenase/glutarate-semialdehyde dehydrogenase
MTDDQLEGRVLEATPHQLYIGGTWRDASGGRRFPVEDPATGRTLVEVADGDAADALAGLAAADEAQPSWAATPPRQRGEILRRTYEMLMERADDLALLMTLEMGKPVAESRVEISYAAEFFRWFSEEAVRVDGRYTVEPNGRGRLLVIQQPVGPCFFITPWNFLMAMATRKLGPAIAAGCTIVIKPAELTPLSTLALTQILTEAGLPPGVLNVITASDPGATTGPVIADPRLRKLSFTGSTPVGKRLMAEASEQVLRVSMELGGNAPFLVFAGADLDHAVEGAVQAKMRNIGEACTAANRFHVHESVADEFARRLADRLGSMKVGRGTEPGVEVGPLIEAKARNKVAELVEDATSLGAEVLTGGAALDGPGYFYPPIVLGQVPHGARMLREEIFGPVAPSSRSPPMPRLLPRPTTPSMDWWPTCTRTRLIRP